jgi:hypothetical protein
MNTYKSKRNQDNKLFHNNKKMKEIMFKSIKNKLISNSTLSSNAEISAKFINVSFLINEVKNSSEYHFVMQNDINTIGYNQWYAFSICNHEKN